MVFVMEFFGFYGFFFFFYRKFGLTNRQHKGFLAPLPFVLSFLRHLCCTHAPVLRLVLPGRRHPGCPGTPSVHQDARQSLLPALAVPPCGAAAPLGTPAEEAPSRPGPVPRPNLSRPCRHPAARSAALPGRDRRRPLLPLPLQHPTRPPARCLFPASKAVGGHQRQSAAPATLAPHHQPLPLTAAARLLSVTLPKITAPRTSENTTVAVRTIFFFMHTMPDRVAQNRI